jgi:hypothetical protein
MIMNPPKKGLSFQIHIVIHYRIVASGLPGNFRKDSIGRDWEIAPELGKAPV